MAAAYAVRTATLGDGVAVAGVYAPFVRDTAVSFEELPPSGDIMAQRIAATLPMYPYLVAEGAAGVVGYAYAGAHSERASYRWSVNVAVYIAPSAHRQGVGRALYGRLLDILTAQRFRSAFAGITLPNPASVGLHEAMGFTPVGVYREVGYKFGQWRDVGWWRRTLAADSAPLEPIPFVEFAARLTSS